MPVHDFRCQQGHVTECMVGHGVNWIYCPQCRVAKAEKVFLRAPMGFVQPDILYTSPIDGRVIRTKAERQEDLRRNNCVEYEPGMRQDFENNRRLDERALDASIDQSVDEFFATAPARKIEKLEQELRAGASAELVRETPTLT